MERRIIYRISALSVLSFGAIWGLIEAGSYFGMNWLQNTGIVGLALLISVAINVSLVLHCFFQVKLKSKNHPKRLSYPTIKELAERLGNTKLLEILVAGGDSFYTNLSQALQMDEAFPMGKRPDLKVLLRRSSNASQRSYDRYKSLEKIYNITVDVAWYDWDFMLRGYAFDRKFAYFSFFLNEGKKLSGRVNDFVTIELGNSDLENFLIDMFCRTIDSFFKMPDSLEKASEASYIQEI